MELSGSDKIQLENKGISIEKVLGQIEIFKEGIPFVRLYGPAIVSNGISKFSGEREQQLIRKFEGEKEKISLLKFVPASGAASRMFKAMFNFLDSYDPKRESLDTYLERTKDREVATFFEGYQNFAFYDLIQKRIAGKTSSKDESKYLFVREMLFEEGLNFGFFPKGLLPFHHYGNYAATPFEEHLREAAAYASVNREANLHFTISEQHGDMFNDEFKIAAERVIADTKVSYTVNYSVQKSATDTIAVTLENKPFRNSDGSLLFRPAGHGSLIENLNEQEADIIFIKNIDNVTVPRFSEEVAKSKKILAGLLLELQGQVFEYAADLHRENIGKEQLDTIKTFMEEHLNVRFPNDFHSLGMEEQVKALRDKINRPIRICGMVKNEGEPGGGPFWVQDQQGNLSLQIIESAQVDISNPEQLKIMKSATHFNPVDLVCGIRNYKGEKFDLLNFVDPKQGFITRKTSGGKELKALELPGLWNGAMAFWNTIFVEVPLTTFNPVKTVNDLLKPAHQVK